MSCGACFWCDEDANGRRDVTEHWFWSDAFLDRGTELGVYHVSIGEFEVSESGEVRGMVHAGLACLGIGGEQSAGFSGKIPIFNELGSSR